MIAVAEAERLILEGMPPLGREDCPLAEAHGRILREDVRADRDFPPFDRATLDGYAVRSASLAAGIARFRVDGVLAAGMVPPALAPAPEACVEIMTGAVLPDGADVVVPYEDAVREGPTMVLGPGKAFAAGHAVHRRGGDRRAGDAVIASGSRLSGREIAVAAACGRVALQVSRSPSIAVVATGDELVGVEATPAAHQIRRSNDYALRAALELAGYPRVQTYHFRDTREDISAQLRPILSGHDAVVVTGGVSKGKFDFLPGELEREGVRRVFHGVAQRPGKPFWFGLSARSVPIFALPGNPAAAYTCLYRFVLPALARAGGWNPPPPRPVLLAAPVSFRPALAYFLPVRLAEGSDGCARAHPAPVNTSGDFAGLVGTDGFLELPAEMSEFPAGYAAFFWAW